MKIQINEFSGIRPKVATDKLTATEAQIAQDVRTESGEIRPYRRAVGDVELTGDSYETLFEYYANSTRNWVTFEGLVYSARSPVANDTFERRYYMGESGEHSEGTITFTDGMTDGETVTVGSQTIEFDIAEDGVGGGNSTCGDSTTISKELCAEAFAAVTPGAAVEFIDNGDGTVTVRATSRGTAGDAIVLTEVGAHITVDGAGTLGTTNAGVDDGIYKAYANDIDSSPWDFQTDFYTPGADAGTAPTLAGYTGSGSDYRAYFYTYVSRYGEEGPGSAISDVTDYASGRMHVDDIEDPDAADTHLTTAVDSNYPSVNIYRTAAATDGTADFLLVCNAYWFSATQGYAVGDFVIYLNDLYECTTIHPAGAWNAGHFTQGELVSTTILTESNKSYLWRRCPDDLTNLRVHPNGFYVASKDKTLYFSEPYAPWAWPEDYEIPLDANIIGLGVFGSTVVVATDGNIYTFSGPHPESMYKQRLAFQPCLSQRAVVETDLGVLFPSKEGFQLVAADSSPQNVTKDLFNPEDWDDYEVETMHGVWFNKAYYGFYSSAEFEGFIKIDFINGIITTGMDYHQAAYVSIGDGIFRTIVASNLNLGNPSLFISRWNTSTTRYRQYVYRSGKAILEKPSNFKVAQVILDEVWYAEALAASGGDLTALNQTAWDETDWGYELGGPINDYTVNAQDVNGDDLYTLATIGLQSYVEFNVYVAGTLKFSKQISSGTMFKLPRGFKSKEWEFEVKGMIPVKRITIATSVEEIV